MASAVVVQQPSTSSSLFSPPSKNNLSSITIDYQDLTATRKGQLAQDRQRREPTTTKDIDPPPIDLPFNPTNPPSHLIASPYPTPPHLLNLTLLDPQTRLFALALTTLSPIRSDDATAPYLSSFNWETVFRTLRFLVLQTSRLQGWERQEFYVVAFRSKIRRDVDGEVLGRLDEESHREAVERSGGGGLLRYWFGVPDPEGRNLATCIWRSREDARVGGSGPWHAKARAAAGQMYERIEFETRRLVVGEEVREWWLEDDEGRRVEG